MWGYDIEYNGKKTADYDMYVMQRPNIPSPELNAQEIEVPGKGSVYIRDGTVSDIDIQICGFQNGEKLKSGCFILKVSES